MRVGVGTPYKAHPRVGGENDFDIEALASALGSSPRGRGKRLGGDASNASWGSSPRGRGKRRADEPPRRRRGLIPAWAGKTSRRASSRVMASAHPRVGGENVVSGS